MAYSGVVNRSVPWWRTLFVRVLAVLVVLSLINISLASALTAAIHRAILEPLIPMAALDEVQRQLIGMLIFVGILTLAISATVAWLLSRTFTRPIQELTRGMQHVFTNDLTVRVPVTRRDEFGSLATFFNSLVKRLRETQNRERAISNLKSQFISVAAHQLRTPLTGLKWSLHWLLEKKGGSLTDEQAKAITAQVTAVNNMTKLVNELLNVALVEEGKFRYVFQKVPIQPLIEEIVAEFSPAAQEKQVTLETKYNLQPNLVLIGDPTQLKYAFSNLIDNAIRYTKPSGTVTVTLTQEKSRLTISIQDTGIGIPAAEQAKLFSRFFRANNAQRLHPDGSGLGLFIVKNIITSHGGDITVSSAENQGTTFTCTLPLQPEILPRESLAEGMTKL